MKGIKKEKAKETPACPRLPITVEVMAKIRDVVQATHGDHDSTMLWAACYPCFNIHVCSDTALQNSYQQVQKVNCICGFLSEAAGDPEHLHGGRDWN